MLDTMQTDLSGFRQMSLRPRRKSGVAISFEIPRFARNDSSAVICLNRLIPRDEVEEKVSFPELKKY